MRKLIYSAFALSLTLTPPILKAQTESIDDFLGIESEVMPALDGPQRFTSPEFHDRPDWRVEEKTVILDKEPLKGQKHSIIPWRGIDPEGFLSIDQWLIDRAIKDKTPDWKIRLRDQRHLELIGRVLKCAGSCPVYQGTEKANVEHLSRIVEGDEFRTEENSFAWIYLVDGTLIRLGGNTSVSFQEVLVTTEEIFYVVRLNHGHVFWHPRSSAPHVASDLRETDAIFLPLMLREANLEFFERERFARQSDREHLREVMDLRDLAIKAQTEKLNALKEKNSAAISELGRSGLVTRVMLYAPNVTLSAASLDLHLIHVAGGKSWFKKGEGSGILNVDLRGYLKESAPDVIGTWQEVAPQGKFLTPATDTGNLEVAELLTKRIPTIELAREMWLEKFTLPLFRAMKDPRTLGIEEGYKLWEVSDLGKRQEYLSEYVRRMETTQLRSLENLFTKLEAAGESPRRELGGEIYQRALDHYLLGLKSSYTQKSMKVREFNDLEYYVWLLRNGKF